MGRMTSLALASLLFACSGAPQWTKAGVPPDQVAQDLSDCQREANFATRRDTNIDNDILATRGFDLERDGVLGLRRASLAADTSGRSDRIVASCMAGKGYAKGGPPN